MLVVRSIPQPNKRLIIHQFIRQSRGGSEVAAICASSSSDHTRCPADHSLALSWAPCVPTYARLSTAMQALSTTHGDQTSLAPQPPASGAWSPWSPAQRPHVTPRRPQPGAGPGSLCIRLSSGSPGIPILPAYT